MKKTTVVFGLLVVVAFCFAALGLFASDAYFLCLDRCRQHLSDCVRDARNSGAEQGEMDRMEKQCEDDTKRCEEACDAGR